MATVPQNGHPVPVLFVTTELRIGGQERKLAEIVRRIDRTRVRPVLAALKKPGVLAPEVEEAGVPIYSGLIRHKLDVLVVPRLIKIIRKEGIRVVCTVGIGDRMFWGRLAGWLGGAKGIVSTIHTTKGPDGGRILERSNRMLTPVTDAFVGVAKDASAYLVSAEHLPRKKVVTIYNGVDLEAYTGEGREEARAELGLDPGAKVVVHVGVFRPEKAHDLLLRAMRKVVDQEPRAILLCAGDGPTREEIDRLRVSLRLEDHVRLLGRRSDVSRILAACDVLTLPSHDRVETFPNCVLEAMASRRPAVCTRVGSVHEMLEDGETGFLIDPGDEAALADRLLQLLGDAGLRERMGTRARAVVEENFSAERMVRDREDLFLALAHGEPIPRRLY